MSMPAEEAIAVWLYNFDGDGKPHRLSWASLSARNQSGFRRCAREFLGVMASSSPPSQETLGIIRGLLLLVEEQVDYDAQEAKAARVLLARAAP
jgi:hypothetical protein